MPSPSVQEPPRDVSAVRDVLSSGFIYAAPLLLQSTGDHRAALRSRRAQGTIALPCTSRACCTSSSVEGAAPRDLVWPLGWRCCRARRLSKRVASCLHQDIVYLVGFLWQWPVATILLAAICQDGGVKHAIVSLAPGCCSLPFPSAEQPAMLFRLKTKQFGPRL